MKLPWRFKNLHFLVDTMVSNYSRDRIKQYTHYIYIHIYKYTLPFKPPRLLLIPLSFSSLPSFLVLGWRSPWCQNEVMISGVTARLLTPVRRCKLSVINMTIELLKLRKMNQLVVLFDNNNKDSHIQEDDCNNSSNSHSSNGCDSKNPINAISTTSHEEYTQLLEEAWDPKIRESFVEIIPKLIGINKPDDDNKQMVVGEGSGAINNSSYSNQRIYKEDDKTPMIPCRGLDEQLPGQVRTIHGADSSIDLQVGDGGNEKKVVQLEMGKPPQLGLDDELCIHSRIRYSRDDLVDIRLIGLDMLGLSVDDPIDCIYREPSRSIIRIEPKPS